MKKSPARRAISVLAFASWALAIGIAGAAQYPIMEKVATKVVQKYQQSSCEQLWQEKQQKQGQPKPPMEEKMMQVMRSDPQMREAFIGRVAAPIANKMFECGMIP
jgi:hypothetical protein